jgi:hypothetical protein
MTGRSPKERALAGGVFSLLLGGTALATALLAFSGFSPAILRRVERLPGDHGAPLLLLLGLPGLIEARHMAGAQRQVGGHPRRGPAPDE